MRDWAKRGRHTGRGWPLDRTGAADWGLDAYTAKELDARGTGTGLAGRIGAAIGRPPTLLTGRPPHPYPYRGEGGLVRTPLGRHWGRPLTGQREGGGNYTHLFTANCKVSPRFRVYAQKIRRSINIVFSHCKLQINPAVFAP